MLEEAKICPECKSEDIVTDFRAGDVVCRGCGIVLGDRIIDDGAEWRTFNAEESQYTNRGDPNRVGGPVSDLVADKGMGTTIQGGSNKIELGRLQKTQSKAIPTSAAEKALLECYGRVREIAHNLGLPGSVAECACLLLKKVEDEGLFQSKRGTRGDAMCGAVMYLACRQQGVSRTLVEVAPAAGVTKKDLTKSFKHLERNLRVDRGTVRAEHIIPRICSSLGLHHEVTQIAKELARAASELDLVGGMQPQGVAGAAVFLVCVAINRPGVVVGGLPPIEEVVSAASTSEKLVRKCYVVLYDHRHKVFPKGFAERMMGKGETVDDIPHVRL
ncbi:unnamed protein product [Choristocarpus tenellus]